MISLGRVELDLMKSKENHYIRIPIPKNDLPNICLNFCALKDGVIEHFLLADSLERTLGIVKISSNEHNYFTTGATSKIFLSSAAIDYTVVFLLRYMRDGIAEVDHIDFDAGLENEETQARTITLVMENSVEPMSSDDMNKLLGL